MFAKGAILTTVSVVLLLVAFHEHNTTGVWIFKPSASLGFLLASTNAPHPSKLMRCGLVFAALGDVLLIPASTFEAGLFSFLVGHILYAVAFARRSGASLELTATSTIPLIPVFLAVHSYLSPYVPEDMKISVIAYMVVVSLMVAFAAGTKNASCIVGALLFYVSDLTVARDQFVHNEFINKAIGLPMYYCAQLVLAWTML